MKKEIVMQDILELVVIDQKANLVINAIQIILLWELLVVVYTTQHAQIDIPLHGIVNLVHGDVLHLLLVLVIVLQVILNIKWDLTIDVINVLEDQRFADQLLLIILVV